MPSAKGVTWLQLGAAESVQVTHGPSSPNTVFVLAGWVNTGLVTAPTSSSPSGNALFLEQPIEKLLEVLKLVKAEL